MSAGKWVGAQGLAAAMILVGSVGAAADEFDKWQLSHVRQAFTHAQWAHPVPRLTSADCRRPGNVLPGQTSLLVVLRTAEGNHAKMLFDFQPNPPQAGQQTLLYIRKLVLFRSDGTVARQMTPWALKPRASFNIEAGALPGALVDFRFYQSGAAVKDTIYLEPQNGAVLRLVRKSPFAAAGGAPIGGIGGIGGPGAPPAAGAGEFSQWTFQHLKQAFLQPAWGIHTTQLSAAQTASYGNVLKGNTGTFLLVRTPPGNYAKMLCQFKPLLPAQPQGLQSLWLTQIVVYRANGTPLYQMQNVQLSPSYSFDLDTGKTASQGADLKNAARVHGIQGAYLESKAGAQMFVVRKSLHGGGGAGPPPGGGIGAQPPASPPGPGQVTPVSFIGQYRVRMDGRWSGTLHLRMLPTGQVQGSSFYTSDVHGNKSFKVTGAVASGTPHQIALYIHIPNALVRLDGWLTTGDKKQILGICYINRVGYGFFATRTP